MASIAKNVSLSKPEMSWAKLVSDVLSPPIVWAALILAIGYHYHADGASSLFWSLIFAVLVCLLPLSYIIYMVARGKIGDLHMRRREDRYKPLVLTVLSSLLTWFIFKTQGAPLVFSLMAMITALQIAVMLVVTLKWQISLHAMAITSVVMASAVIFGVQVGLALVPLIVLVSSARLYLNCHTPSQIFAGAMVGAIVPIALILLADNAILPLL